MNKTIFEKMQAEYDELSANVRSKLADVKLDADRDRMQAEFQARLDDVQADLNDLKEAGDDTLDSWSATISQKTQELRDRLAEM